ncbi:RNA-processing protein [Candidatus Woesearchaeota archaeon]|jgi:ribosomal RNA assembly protein|nr:RNA-processing protein [Candidatus Woesearchaeota archaeon]
MEFHHEIKIPKERIAVLIGKSGEIKHEIEEETNTKINIDSKEGDVNLSGEDSLGIFIAKDVIKAIARGFNPDLAKLLLKGDYTFDMVNIQDYTGKSKKDSLRLKGRVIGTEGKSRRHIEDLTETNISVYGKTIAIIGRAEDTNIARKAVESLLAGSAHTSVYKWLEKKKKEKERNNFLQHTEPEEHFKEISDLEEETDEVSSEKDNDQENDES